MALDKKELKKLLKEKGVKSLDDFNAFMREISKEVVETILGGGLTDYPGYERQHDLPQRASPRQAGLPSHRGGVEEMDHAPQRVAYDILPTDGLFWGPVGGAGLDAIKRVTQKICNSCSRSGRYIQNRRTRQ